MKHFVRYEHRPWLRDRTEVFTTQRRVNNSCRSAPLIVHHHQRHHHHYPGFMSRKMSVIVDF